MAIIKTVSAGFPAIAGSVVTEWRQQEQKTLQISITDSSNTAVNLTNYVLTANAEFYLVDSVSVNVTDTETTYNIGSQFSAIDGVQNKSLNVSKATDPTTGVLTLTIPEDLYTGEIAVNATSDVPVAVIYLNVSDGQTVAHKYTLTYLVVMRHGI